VRINGETRRVIGCLVCFIAAVFGCTDLAEAQATKQQPTSLSAYRSAVLAARGDAERGRRLFENANRSRCLLCHAIEGRGGTTGPDLMGAGARYNRVELLESVQDLVNCRDRSLSRSHRLLRS
jgi:mono/diheme cytochrome c family protein